MVRILVIGSGSIGKRHAENLTLLGAQVDAVGWRQTSLGDVATRLRSVDGVVIATATDLRLPLIEAAAMAGIPAYIEKPLAFCPQDITAVEDIARPIAERSMLGYMMRYHPAFRVLAASDLSDVFHFHLSIGHDVTQWRANWRFSDSYAARATGGGVLLDLCHELDMASCLFPGLGVTAVHSIGHAGFAGVDMASTITLSGAAVTGEVTMDYLTPALHRRCTLHGTQRMFDFDFAAQHYTLTDASGPADIAAPMARNAMFLEAMRDFLALVQGRKVSDVEHLPRLDLCLPSARLVAHAWAARTFTGTIAKDMS
jgi:predicted dehydrogenase